MGRNLGPLNIKDSYEGLVQISGSQLTDGSGSLISNLEVTASYATTADASISASYAQTSTSASHALVADVALNVPATASYALYAEVAGFATSSLSASHALVADLATTASYVENSISASYAVSSSHSEISDFAFSATSASFATTSLLATSASHANNSDTAISASYAVTASYAENAGSSTLQEVLDAGNNATGSIVLRNDEASNPAIQVNSPSGSSSTLLRLSRLSDNTNNFVVTAGDATNATLSIGTGVGYGQINLNASGLNKIEATTKLGIETPLLTINNTSGGTQITGSLNVTGSVFVKGNLQSGAATNTGHPTLGYAIIGANTGMTANGAWSALAGGQNNSIGSNGLFAFIGGGNGNQANNSDNVVLGGQNNVTSNSRSGILAGFANTNSGTNSAIVAGQNNTNAGQNGVITGGAGNGITGGNDNGFYIYGAQSGVVNSNGGAFTGVIGGESNTIRNFYSIANDAVNGYPREMYGLIAGGRDNRIGVGVSSNQGSNGIPLILGGLSNRIGPTTGFSTYFTKYSTILNSSASIVDSGSFQGIIGGYQNYISGSDNSYIISSNNSTISGHTNTVILGGSNITSTKDNEVTVPHLTISGSVTAGVYTLTDVAGTTTMDCSLGNFFTLTMPAGGSTTLTPSNIQAGQTINVKITQNATPSTIAFDASVDFEGGTAFVVSTGAGEVDVMTFVSFDGTSLQATGLKNFS